VAVVPLKSFYSFFKLELMNLRDFWAAETAKLRDTSYLFEGLTKANTRTKKSPDPNDEVKGKYIFSELGMFLTFEPTQTQAILQLGNKIFKFNDPITDVGAIEYNIEKGDAFFKKFIFVHQLSNTQIEKMMSDSHVKKDRNRISIAWESVGGELDFAVYHLVQVIAKVMLPTYWNFEKEILKDKGPLFIMPNYDKVYNLLDAGNWLWGNAMNRMGYALKYSLEAARKYDNYDTNADQRAITDGWNAYKE
jgi:hypothetical protein